MTGRSVSCVLLGAFADLQLTISSLVFGDGDRKTAGAMVFVPRISIKPKSPTDRGEGQRFRGGVTCRPRAASLGGLTCRGRRNGQGRRAGTGAVGEEARWIDRD